MDEYNIKPCPFCGGDAKVIERQIGDCLDYYYDIQCCKNDLHSLDLCMDTPEEAVTIWNERPEEKTIDTKSNFYKNCCRRKERSLPIMEHYWHDCISEACEEAGVNATDEQIELIADCVKGAHENYGMYSGNDIATSNRCSEIETEVRSLKENLKKEKEKRGCSHCRGTGSIWCQGPGVHGFFETCIKCNGTGKL